MITTYTQLIQELDECIEHWRKEDDDNCCTMIENSAFRTIAEYAIHKGLDYDIGNYKLSFILADDQESKQYDVLEDCSTELLGVFVEMLISPESVMDDYPIPNNYQIITNPDPELVTASLHFLKSLWPDYN